MICRFSSAESGRENPLYGRHEFNGAHWLLEVVSHTSFEGRGTDPLGAVTCEHDHREDGANGSQFEQYFESGAIRQPVIEHDEIDVVTAQTAKGPGARCRDPYFVHLAKEEADNFGNDRVVVYDQDLLPPDGRSAVSAIWTSPRLEHNFQGRELEGAIPTSRTIAFRGTKKPFMNDVVSLVSQVHSISLS